MPILVKKPIGGKLVKGRDHTLRCVLTWDDGTNPTISTDIEAFYVSIKVSDADEDTDAIISLNSIDNPDQFTTIDDEGGEFDFWLKKTDQDDIIPDKEKYCMDMVAITTDGKEWPYILDNNIVFTQPATRTIGS